MTLRSMRLALPAWHFPARLSLAGPRLVAQDGKIAEHPNDHRAFRQGIHLICGARLFG
ncbi:hypothetical protein [Paracoccus sphaerophysae]|uniref:hypothetical protein n=1 Tax=Paracoccus sphaerophysae TaxID=690417 RepID=UPI000AE02FF9|nr:hypothetical protein [Paracoccus sphaerophysae]